ncbi:hypothetical protein [Moraxella catarrhalis]|uniref:Uncharacterized protein n=1 Tax=Moraxella catarrhalis TaxID=480 RepID=A0ABY0BLR1_MORCA|nr:hypothetical protein [Moraxella catarrhalis]AKI28063.1 hypothetical protein [Moraxella phage Mcat24]AKI28112.1 hypothetical protein [Moraxella phage Mcat25]AKI28164.1 hypothetical protein [Moraxella phage Mcat26]AKI28219.1 hypothetical protein [Moraxella phage Mcat27]AKI28305.1 hypothetical protein [Moraxella phage Mcat28]AKI28356.1 hypothetical protein [Moraxella phage Mcat29]AKI28372.1 hypothetical protein [Moraxella phage Mcat30]AKI28450.1 hypothetical protein [Moraxella phage Mcat31]
MGNPIKLAESLLGKQRILVTEIEGRVNDVRLVDEILQRNGYRKFFGSSSQFKGWIINSKYLLCTEYAV